LVAETGGAQRPLAVTNLEHFAVCAFQGFARQVLRASHERPLRELPDAREAGTLTHRALAAAFTATAPLWSERPRDAARILALAEQATEEVLQQQSVASVLRRLALARVRAGVSAVLAWSLADENWDFVHAEAPFGDRRDAWPPLVLDDGASRVALRGSIDRVDVAHGRAAVRAIDYKTSARAAESGMRELGDTAFQVPLYARAAADALRRPERRGLYLFVQRPGDVGAKVAKEFEGAWNTLHAREKEDRDLTLLEAAAIRVVRRVREGAIAPRPHDESACARCDASGGCRKPRFAIMRDEPEGRG
jgi:RecB family exonuclease